MVGVGEYKRNDQSVGNDRRDRTEVSVPPQSIASQGAEQCCQRAENDVGQRAARDQVADKASERQAGDRGGGKERQDRQALRKADLYGAAGQVETCSDHSQDSIERGDQRCIGDIICFVYRTVYVLIHCVILLSFGVFCNVSQLC